MTEELEPLWERYAECAEFSPNWEHWFETPQATIFDAVLLSFGIDPGCANPNCYYSPRLSVFRGTSSATLKESGMLRAITDSVLSRGQIATGSADKFGVKVARSLKRFEPQPYHESIWVFRGYPEPGEVPSADWLTSVCDLGRFADWAVRHGGWRVPPKFEALAAEFEVGSAADRTIFGGRTSEKLTLSPSYTHFLSALTDAVDRTPCWISEKKRQEKTVNKSVFERELLGPLMTDAPYDKDRAARLIIKFVSEIYPGAFKKQ